MKNYQWILFDADKTLFSFDVWTGLQNMFSELNVEFTQADFEAHETLSRALWKDYQNTAITAEKLQIERFSKWAARLNKPALELNQLFLDKMLEISTPLEGVMSLMQSLKNKYKMGIITNGFNFLQEERLERTGLKEYIDLLVVSEEVGIPKPQVGIFNHALSLMGNPSREHVLMVGDMLETDILGGNNAGLDTCWLNSEGKASSHIKPHYQISSLLELEKLLK